MGLFDRLFGPSESPVAKRVRDELPGVCPVAVPTTEFKLLQCLVMKGRSIHGRMDALTALVGDDFAPQADALQTLLAQAVAEVPKLYRFEVDAPSDGEWLKMLDALVPNINNGADAGTKIANLMMKSVSLSDVAEIMESVGYFPGYAFAKKKTYHLAVVTRIFYIAEVIMTFDDGWDTDLSSEDAAALAAGVKGDQAVALRTGANTVQVTLRDHAKAKTFAVGLLPIVVKRDAANPDRANVKMDLDRAT